MNSILITQIKTTFIKRFDAEPILVTAPGRINLIGEHTDYNDGFVLPAAIDKSIVSAIAKSNTDNCSIFSLNNNDTFVFSLMEIQPLKMGGWQNYVMGVVAEIHKKGKTLQSFNLVFGGDIPIGSGLSSSAALENSIVFALNELFDLGLTKLEMIYIAQAAEHNFVGVKCGIMDQFASMFGLKNHALFLDCRSLNAIPLDVNLEGYSLILINTNIKHNLAENAYNERRLVCEKVATILNVKALRDATVKDLKTAKHLLSHEDYNKALYIIEENKRVEKAVEYLNDEAITAFGNLLFEAHIGLKDQYKVSCDELDFLVEFAKASPYVIGARMMGGGFGGCAINIVVESRVDDFILDVKNAYFDTFSTPCSEIFVQLSDGTQRLLQK